MKCSTVVEVLILLLSLNARILGETNLPNSVEFFGNRSKYKPIKARNQEKSKTINNTKIVNDSKTEGKKKENLKQIESIMNQKMFKDPKLNARNDTSNNSKSMVVTDKQVIFIDNEGDQNNDELHYTKNVQLHSDDEFKRGCYVQAVLCNILKWEAEMTRLIDYAEFMNCFSKQQLNPRHHFKLRNLIKQLTKDQVLKTFINYLNQLNLNQTFSLAELNSKCNEYQSNNGTILDKPPTLTDENTTNALPYENNNTDSKYVNQSEQNQRCSNECCKECRTNIHSLNRFVNESLNNSQELTNHQVKQFYDTIGKLNAKNEELINQSEEQSKNVANIQNSLSKVAGYVTELKASPEQCCTKWENTRNEFDRKYKELFAANKESLNTVKEQMENINTTLNNARNLDGITIEQQKNDLKKFKKILDDLGANEKDRREEMETLQDKVAATLKTVKKITSNVEDNTKQQSATLENLEEKLNKYTTDNVKQGDQHKNKIKELERLMQNINGTMQDNIKLNQDKPEANDAVKKLLQETENTVVKTCNKIVESSKNDLQKELEKQKESDKNNDNRIQNITKIMELQERNIAELREKLVKATAEKSTAAPIEQEELEKLKERVDKVVQDLVKVQKEDGKDEGTKKEIFNKQEMKQSIKKATDEVVHTCNKRIDDVKSDFEMSLNELKKANEAARKREIEFENQLNTVMKLNNENLQKDASQELNDKLNTIEANLQKCETSGKENNAQIVRLNVRVTALEQKNVGLDKTINESQSLLRKSGECSAAQYNINQDLDERLFQIEQIFNRTLNNQLSKGKKKP